MSIRNEICELSDVSALSLRTAIYSLETSVVMRNASYGTGFNKGSRPYLSVLKIDFHRKSMTIELLSFFIPKVFFSGLSRSRKWGCCDRKTWPIVDFLWWLTSGDLFVHWRKEQTQFDPHELSSSFYKARDSPVAQSSSVNLGQNVANASIPTWKKLKKTEWPREKRENSVLNKQHDLLLTYVPKKISLNLSCPALVPRTLTSSLLVGIKRLKTSGSRVFHLIPHFFEI